jgi:hypothetical protein
MIVSVFLEIVLTLMQNRCTICVEHTIGSQIILDTAVEHLWVMWNLISDHLEIVLVSVQDRCTVLRRTNHELENHFGHTRRTLW